MAVAFSDRKTHFAGVAATGALAIDTATGVCVGYCIRSFSPESVGESGSIGNRAPVADGDEGTLPFHRRYRT